MKKILFIAALMAVAFASCKKENKNEPTPADPVVNDSVDLKMRVYATIDQMQYLNYQVYVTFPGESKERKIDMTNPVELDDTYDGRLLVEMVNRDSIMVYNLDARVKKGDATYRFEYSKADSMPELIDLIFGANFISKAWVSGDEISIHKSVETSTIDRFMSLILKNYPVTIRIE